MSLTEASFSPSHEAVQLPPAPSRAAGAFEAAANESCVIAAGRECFDIDLQLRHAGTRRLRIACEWQGPQDAPVIVVAGGISAHKHLSASLEYAEPGWWQSQVGPGRALDSSRFRLLAIDWIGSDGTFDAPIDSADQADAIAAVLDRLAIVRVAAFVGASYGAMVGLQFAARHGHRLGALVAISGGDRAHPYSQAWRGLQREIVQLGASEGGRRQALSLARQLAMLSYRTPEEFAQRFDAPARFEDGVAQFAAQDYLHACGERYVARTPATAFLRLSESIDLHEADAAQVRVPTTLVAVHEDRLVPRDDLVALAERLPRLRRLHLLRSPFGHDAFLKEEGAIAKILGNALAAACQPGAQA